MCPRLHLPPSYAYLSHLPAPSDLPHHIGLSWEDCGRLHRSTRVGCTFEIALVTCFNLEKDISHSLIFPMTITNSCAAGREMPRTNNQSRYIHHGHSPGDRVYGQTVKSRKPYPPYYENCTSNFVLHSSRILECGQKRQIEPTRHRPVASSQIINNASPQ